jgi:carbamoyltransferase
MEKSILSIYGSHDASATFVDKNGDLRVLEYERFAKVRYSYYSSYFDGESLGTTEELRKKFLIHIRDNIKKQPDLILYNQVFDSDYPLLKEIFYECNEFKLMPHHNAHAACGYYQSEFDEALIFTFDGGGNDYGVINSTCVFEGKGNEIKQIYNSRIDYGVAYGMLGQAMKEIPNNYDASALVYAGKVMGICAYGKVVDQLKDPIRRYYSHGSLETLGSEIGLDLTNHSIEGQLSYDIAATSQFIFEELLFDFIKKYFENKKTNVVFSGGCALNVLFNQKLKEYITQNGFDLYVPPNPNDCGLSIGQYLLQTAQKIKPNPYSGFEILDEDNLDTYSKKYNFQKSTPEKIVSLISSGKIGGVVRGYSEVGPRALGNRSIICDPSFKDMKDILNFKVKFREWFRPFAPVCREEDRNLYFENAYPSEYMSYAPTVRENYREKLPSITHFDGTARLQTARKDQHEFFYDILTEMNNVGKIPIILNTSFNIKGKPILTTIEDAFYVLENTELDFLVIQDTLIEK